MIMEIIDVSKHNGLIDFNQVKKAGIEGVIIRAGYGKSTTQKDPYFEDNYRRARRAGLHVGAYWFSYTKTQSGARDEARACLDVIKDKVFDLPIYYDVEEKDQIKEGSSFLEGIITIFLSELEANDKFCGLYMSRAYMEKVPVRCLVKYSLWVADWNDKCNFNLLKYGMWQYTSKGVVAGITGDVDRSRMYFDYPTIIKNARLNGYNNIYDLSLLEEKISNEEDLKILYQCRDELLKLRERYL